MVTDKGGKGTDFMSAMQFSKRKVCHYCGDVGNSETIKLDKTQSRLRHRCVDRAACRARQPGITLIQ